MNPSLHEFPEDDPFHRFPLAVGAGGREPSRCLAAMSAYFAPIPFAAGSVLSSICWAALTRANTGAVRRRPCIRASARRSRPVRSGAGWARRTAPCAGAPIKSRHAGTTWAANHRPSSSVLWPRRPRDAGCRAEAAGGIGNTGVLVRGATNAASFGSRAPLTDTAPIATATSGIGANAPAGLLRRDKQFETLILIVALPCLSTRHAGLHHMAARPAQVEARPAWRRRTAANTVAFRRRDPAGSCPPYAVAGASPCSS